MSSSHAESGNISIWDIVTGKQLVSFEAQKGWCNAAIFLQDEETLLSTGYGGNIKIWNWKMRNLISKFVIKGAGNAYQLQLNRNHDRIAAIVTFPKDPNDFGFAAVTKVFVWTFPDFRPLFSMDLNETKGDSKLGFSPDGLRIAIEVQDENDSAILILRKIEGNEKTILPIRDHLQPFTALEFSTDGRLLAGGSDSAIHIWDADPESTNFGRCIKVLNIKTNCQGVFISGARGIELKRKSEVGGQEQKDTLLEFFAERGAVLDKEQKQILAKARKLDKEMQSNEIWHMK